QTATAVARRRVTSCITARILSKGWVLTTPPGCVKGPSSAVGRGSEPGVQANLDGARGSRGKVELGHGRQLPRQSRCRGELRFVPNSVEQVVHRREQLPGGEQLHDGVASRGDGVRLVGGPGADVAIAQAAAHRAQVTCAQAAGRRDLGAITAPLIGLRVAASRTEPPATVPSCADSEGESNTAAPTRTCTRDTSQSATAITMAPSAPRAAPPMPGGRA